MSYMHVVFDMDGTLVDSERGDVLSLQSTLRDLMGHERTYEELRVVCGAIGSVALAEMGYTQEEIARIYPVWFRRTAETLGDAPLFPGVEAVLTALRARGCRLGVVTSRQRDMYELGAAPNRFERFFIAAVCQEDTEKHKPAPEPLLAFMEQTGAAPARTLFVGDSRFDMECARAAGVDSALALWGAPNPDLPATYRLRTPQELLSLF